MPEEFVLDCSVAAKWVLPEPDRAPALELFEQYASGEVLLIAPDILLAEFASLVARRNRRKQISAQQALQAFAWMTKCAPRLFDTRPRLSRALDLSLLHQLSLWNLLWRSEDDNSTLQGRSPLTEEESATRRTRRRRLVVY